ncbi:hypothetical protein CR66_07980 [Campylobacter mucosalis]|uniref:cytochrome-c peroxidase n=1 Tax=Campylobacter mucosalis TaxID=202 RepID=UPI0004DB1E05|nr:cytochrome c peroxidase [Campylobacter mucosalis]KEA45446.1 hypothetical protein CR66_07980 [Campylobacter mucosalis]QKF63774.1 cytochrome c peroxidase [Campylobacter mucosalis]
MGKIFYILFLATFAMAQHFVPSTGLSYNEAKAELGKKMFFDKRLSKNQTFSCESCHNLYWDFSGTIRKNIFDGKINPPSILNAASNYLFFKYGNERNMSKQILTSITSTKELSMSVDELVKRLYDISEYRSEFIKVYNEGIKIENIIESFIHFQKAIFTANSAFDRFLLGDKNALNDDEKMGMQIFIDAGCVACHNGVNLGGGIRQQSSFFRSVFEKSDTPNELGAIFALERIRVAPLRNVARTAPYMSNGSITNLKIAISHTKSIDRNLDQKDVEYIEKFLKTLSGEHPRILK